MDRGGARGIHQAGMRKCASSDHHTTTPAGFSRHDFDAFPRLEFLIEALRTGQIAGAAPDVFCDEPKVPPELMRMENVVLAPHIGTSTVEIREGRSAKLLGDLRAHFSGKPPSYPVEVNN